MSSAVLALGANLGDALGALQGAVDSLESSDGISVTASSPVFVTKAVGGPEQPSYLNAVLLIQTSLTPIELLDRANAIEADWHRTREVRWGPRTLDIDIIDFDALESTDERLTLPHPRAAIRGFVLIPWLAVDPRARLSGALVRDLLASIDGSGVEILKPPQLLRVPA